MTDEHDETDPEDSRLEHGALYWDTQHWKSYAPYREDDDFVYMVTVRRKSAVEDALENDALVAHEERLADSPFEDVEAVASFRAKAAEEARAIADLLSDRSDAE